MKLRPVIKWQQGRILFIPQTHCPHFSAKLALPRHTVPTLPSHKSACATRGTAVDHRKEAGQAHGHPSAHPCTQKDLTFLELCQCAVKIGSLLPARQQRSRFNPQKKARKQHLRRAVSVSEPLHRQGFSPSSVFLQPWGLQRKLMALQTLTAVGVSGRNV